MNIPDLGPGLILVKSNEKQGLARGNGVATERGVVACEPVESHRYSGPWDNSIHQIDREKYAIAILRPRLVLGGQDDGCGDQQAQRGAQPAEHCMPLAIIDVAYDGAFLHVFHGVSLPSATRIEVPDKVHGVESVNESGYQQGRRIPRTAGVRVSILPVAIQLHRMTGAAFRVLCDLLAVVEYYLFWGAAELAHLLRVLPRPRTFYLGHFSLYTPERTVAQRLPFAPLRMVA